MNTCLALLLSFGINPVSIDTTRVYEIPKAVVAQMSLTQQAEARYCAWRYKIKWRIVK